MICRETHVRSLLDLLDRNPVVALLGARQVGKTTLSRQLAEAWTGPGEATTFDLEDPVDESRLSDGGLALRPLRGLVILDEVQRRPDLFPLLRVLADRPDVPARFLLLGSASPSLARGVSESLAGRLAFHELGGFSLDEVGQAHAEQRWLRGGLPRAFLAGSDAESHAWRRDFLQSALERDLPQMGLNLPPATLRRFWTMLAHRHGAVFNGADFGRAFGVSGHAIRRYLDVLCGTYFVRVLQPWHENTSKRQVRSPKVYVADTGLAHALLNLRTLEDLLAHPACGATWEGFVISEVTSRLGAQPEECHFWATHAGAELDLLVVRGSRRLGFEVKRAEAPRLTPSMRSAIEDLHLERLWVVHAGARSYPMADAVMAAALRDLDAFLPAGLLDG